jgi:ankyrin repeat protein
MKTGKVIAILFFASWIIGIGAFVMLRPTFKHGKELLKAAQAGKTAEVVRLVENGANVQVRDREGKTALAIAAYYNSWEMAAALLKHGADPNARGYDGWTPLMRAAKNGNREVIRVLASHGANVNAVGLNGETALKLAADRPETAVLLRELGAK